LVLLKKMSSCEWCDISQDDIFTPFINNYISQEITTILNEIDKLENQDAKDFLKITNYRNYTKTY
jgi:hypothetical protein